MVGRAAELFGDCVTGLKDRLPKVVGAVRGAVERMTGEFCLTLAGAAGRWLTPLLRVVVGLTLRPLGLAT